MNIYAAIKEGSEILKKNDIKYPDLDCEILLAKVIKNQRKHLILNLDKQINKKNLEIESFRKRESTMVILSTS